MPQINDVSWNFMGFISLFFMFFVFFFLSFFFSSKIFILYNSFNYFYFNFVLI